MLRQPFDGDEIPADIQPAMEFWNDKFVRTIVCLLPLALCCCAAINARETDGAGRPYIGVRYDAYWLAHPSQLNQPVSLPFCVLDMPFSFAVDTICLPYDLAERSREQTFNPREKIKK